MFIVNTRYICDCILSLKQYPVISLQYVTQRSEPLVLWLQIYIRVGEVVCELRPTFETVDLAAEHLSGSLSSNERDVVVELFKLAIPQRSKFDQKLIRKPKAAHMNEWAVMPHPA